MSKIVATRLSNKDYNDFIDFVQREGFMNPSDALRQIVRDRLKQNSSEKNNEIKTESAKQPQEPIQS